MSSYHPHPPPPPQRITFPHPLSFANNSHARRTRGACWISHEAGKFGRSHPVDFHEMRGWKPVERKDRERERENIPSRYAFSSFYDLSVRTRFKRDSGDHIFQVCIDVREFYMPESPTTLAKREWSYKNRIFCLYLTLGVRSRLILAIRDNIVFSNVKLEIEQFRGKCSVWLRGSRCLRNFK